MIKIKFYLSYVLTFVLLLTFFSGKCQNPLRYLGSEHSSIGIFIQDLKTGKIVADYNGTVAHTPASVLKALTCATALEKLGPDFQFKTEFILQGCNPAEGDANMTIIAGADPTLGSREFIESRHVLDSLCTRLTDLGITYIHGDIEINSNILPEGGGVVPQWEVEDISQSYGVGLYPINWMDNYFEEKMIIPSPPDFFKEQLLETLAMSQIEVAGEKNSMQESPNDTIPIYTHFSAPLKEILRSMMVRSDNLMAEGVFRALGPNMTSDSVIGIEKEHWLKQGIDLKYSRILDGNGLARGNSLSPRQIGSILKHMAKSEYAKEYVSLFPKCGIEGTVKNFLRNTRLASKMVLKSGTMTGVHCYAGYRIDIHTGLPTHTVVIMVNNFYCTRYQLRKAIENYLLQILP